MLDEASGEIAALRQRLAASEAAAAEAVERQQQLATSAQTLTDRCTALGSRLSQSEQRCHGLERALAEASERARAADAAEQRAADALAERERSSRTALEELRQTLAARETALAEALAARETDLARLEAAVAAREQLTARLSDAERAHAASMAAARESAAGLEEAAARLAALEQAHDEARAGDAAATAQAAELRDEVATLRAALAQERGDATAALDEALSDVAAVRMQLADGERELAALHAALAEREEAVAERDDLRRQLAVLGEDAAMVAPRCAAAEAERDALAVAVAQLQDQLLRAAGEHEEWRSRAARLEEGMLAARETESRLRAELSGRGERLGAAESQLERLAAARDRLVEELALAQQQLGASRTTGEQLEARVAASERAAEAARERHAELEAQALVLQQQLVDGEGRLAALASQRDEALGARDSLAAMLESERARMVEPPAAAPGDALAALQERLVESEAEAADLRVQVSSLGALRDALQGEREDMRRRLAGAEEAERQKGELARLQARLEEVERQQADATQRHSQAVSLYMLELNQRSDALHQRDLEVQRLQEQLRVVESAVEDGAAQLSSLRRERDLYELQVRELESQRPRQRPVEAPVAIDDDLLDAVEETVAEALPLEPEPVATEMRLVDSKPAPAAAAPVKPVRRVQSTDEPRLVIHVEDHDALRDAVRAEVERCGGLQYTALCDCSTDVPGIDPLLAVNLLAKDCDPLEAICDARWGMQEPRAFTYLASGTRGVIAGVTDIIPHPFSPDDCATRLLERPGGTQRLLMVSDKIEVMNEIRAVLNRVKCSTSVALDGRQAYDLVSMVKPDAILIDLTLPRAEGIRLVNRLRSDAKTATIPIIFALGEALDLARFRADATRVLADCRFSPQDLSSDVARVLVDWQNDQDGLRATG